MILKCIFKLDEVYQPQALTNYFLKETYKLHIRLSLKNFLKFFMLYNIHQQR